MTTPIPVRYGIEPDVYSVLDDEGIAHAILPHWRDPQYPVTVCVAWKHLRVHSHMVKMRFVELQPVTCLECVGTRAGHAMPLLGKVEQW